MLKIRFYWILLLTYFLAVLDSEINCFFLFVSLRAMLSGTQGSLPALRSGFIPGGSGEPYWISGIEPGLVTCKARTILLYHLSRPAEANLCSVWWLTNWLLRVSTAFCLREKDRKKGQRTS